MRRTRLVLVLLALGLAALFLVLEERRRSPDPGDIDHAEETPETPAAVRLEGRPPAEPESAPAPSGSFETKVWLKGTVSVAGDRVVSAFDPPLDVRVSPKMLRIDSFTVFWPVETKLEAPGAFAIDLTDPCRRMKAYGRSEYVHLQAAHPDHVTVEQRIPVPDVDALLAGTATFDLVDLVLRPVGAVTGIVEDVDGGPLEGACVLLYRLADGAPERHPVDEGYSVEGGRYHVRCAQGGKHLVVAAHRHYDEKLNVVACRAPASRLVDVRVDRVTEDVRLRLRPSYRVRGIVRHAGRAAGGADLEWRLAGEVHALRYGKDPEWGNFVGLAYAGGAVHWAWEEIGTDTDGTFVILGLSALPYRLRVTHVPKYQEAKQLPDGVEQKILNICKRAYRNLNLSGYARMDLRLTEGDEVYLLEANPNPELSYGGEFAESAEAVGLSYEQLLQRILNLGLSYRAQWQD